MLYYIYSGRIVTVASSVHNLAVDGMQWHDLHYARNHCYSMFPSYAQSKLANILFTKELHQRLQSVHSGITAIAVHPGCVRTDVTRNMALWMRLGDRIASPVMCTLMKSREQGAYSTLHALLNDLHTDGDEDSGSITGSEGGTAIHGGKMYFHGELYRHMSYASADMEEAKKLWEVSAELVGLNNRRTEIFERFDSNYKAANDANGNTVDGVDSSDQTIKANKSVKTVEDVKSEVKVSKSPTRKRSTTPTKATKTPTKTKNTPTKTNSRSNSPKSSPKPRKRTAASVVSIDANDTSSSANASRRSKSPHKKK